MKKSTFSFLKLFLGWPLSLVAVYFIFTFISPHFQAVLSVVTHVRMPFLFLSIFSFLVYFLLRTLLWRKIFLYKGHAMRLSNTAYLWSLSEIKRFLPGGVWAFLGRTHAFAKDDVKKRTVLSAILIEAEAIFLGSMTVSFLAFPFLEKLSLGRLWGGLLLLAACTAGGIFLFGKQITKKLPKFVHHTLPVFSVKQNVILLVYAVMALLFFSLGTYLSILSISALPLNNTFAFIGFFAFSFFVGYIALFDPMGLGIREGTITVGLSQSIGITLAATAAIFTRIILVFAEVLFLGMTTISHARRKIRLPASLPWVRIILGIALGIYIVYFTTASFLRYANFYTGRFDLGNMDQTVWNTVHGRIFQFTNPDSTNIVSRLTFHADFLLILLAPFYLFWQDPRMLLLIQTCMLAAGAVFIYRIAKHVVKDITLSCIFACLYLLNPSVEHSNLYDFHAVTLATTFFLGAWYFFLKDRFWLTLVLLLLVGCSKEEAWLVVGIFSLFAAWRTKKRVFWVSFSVLCFGFFWFLLSYAIPHVRGGQHFALYSYAELGATPKAIVKTLMFSPWKALFLLFQKSKLYYLFQLSLPLGFLFLLSPGYLLFALPDFAVNLLTNNSQYYQIYFHYTALITPVLFISALYGTKKFLTKYPRFFSFLIWYLGMCTLIAIFLYSPLPYSRSKNTNMFTKPHPFATTIDNFLSDIPSQYTIAASNNLGSHLSHRQKIFTIPVGINEADVILFLLNDKFAQPSLAAQKRMVEQMKQDKHYIEIFKLGDFIVFEKRNLYAVTEPQTEKVKLYPVSIPTLQNRDFVGSKIKIGRELERNTAFAKFSLSYISDGLALSGIIEIPQKDKPISGFPIVIINAVTAEDNGASDFFASHGFIVIKPDYRGHGNSERDPDITSIPSYAIDVLNLIAPVTTIENADAKNIFLWGQEVGGGITLSALEAHDQNKNFTNPIKAASVWSPIADPYRGYTRMRQLFPRQKNVPYGRLYRALGPYRTNKILWQSVSPLYYLDDIMTPLQISHGIADTVIPYHWSIELYNDLFSLNKSTKLRLYPGGDHTLSGLTDKALTEDLQFFKKYMN